jgi:hypothetical protein
MLARFKNLLQLFDLIGFNLRGVQILINSSMSDMQNFDDLTGVSKKACEIQRPAD